MQKNYGLRFLSYGKALPEKIVKNTDLEKLFDTSDEWIYSRTGIKERRVVSGTETGLDLCVRAAKEALSKVNFNPKDIDLIIVCTSTPDRLYPSTSCMLQSQVGASNAVGFDLSAACSGYIFGLATASQFIYTGQYKNILLVGVDIHSRFLDWEERSVSILFGDGAGAALITRCLAKDDELLGFVMHSESDNNLDLVLDNANVSFCNFQKNISASFVRMNGKVVFQFALKVVPRVITELLEQLGMSNSDFDYLILHQANQRIIDAVAEKMKLQSEKIISNIKYVGNTSGASIPILIAESLNAGAIKTPSKLLLVGFGAGLTWGSAMIKCTV